MPKNKNIGSNTMAYMKLFRLISQENFYQAVFLFIMMLTMAVLEVLGVASILPFIAVLSNPDIMSSNVFLKTFYEIFSFDNQTQFLIFLGVGSLSLLIISLAFKTLTTFFQVRFALMKEYSIGKNLFEIYLNQPFSWFLNRNSANLNKIILSEVTAVVQGGILNFVNALSQILVIIIMLIMLTFVNLSATVFLSAGLGLAYLSIFMVTKTYLGKIGRKKVDANDARFAAVSEGFGAIKEIKAYSIESYFIEKFSSAAKSYASNLSIAHAINQLPRYILEAIAFGSLMLILVYNVAIGGDLVFLLPQITIFALAAYRLMPALNQVYSALSQIKFHAPAISDVYNETIINRTVNLQKRVDTAQSIPSGLSLENVSYAYPNSEKLILENINLEIVAGSKFAIIGKTGSGKSTLINLILGLVEPGSGSIKINKDKLTGSKFWNFKQLIGYVPQDIFIIDDTITANIALGVDPKHVDTEMVERASKIANLHEYVINNASNGYQTVVGDRGIRLSGGERQRIGIARALYRQPKILILDEATSSLDTITENTVMEAVDNLSITDITVIIVAHRLSTVKSCQNIVLIDDGKIVDQGTFDYLASRNEIFALGTT
jgi:ABC-type multidrug transport system fused ATPase/permease subunit